MARKFRDIRSIILKVYSSRDAPAGFSSRWPRSRLSWACHGTLIASKTSPRPVPHCTASSRSSCGAGPALQAVARTSRSIAKSCRRPRCDYTDAEGAQVTHQTRHVTFTSAFLRQPISEAAARRIALRGPGHSAFEVACSGRFAAWCATRRTSTTSTAERSSAAIVASARLRRGVGGQGSDECTEVAEPVTHVGTTVSGSAQNRNGELKTVPTPTRYATASSSPIRTDGPGTIFEREIVV